MGDCGIWSVIWRGAAGGNSLLDFDDLDAAAACAISLVEHGRADVLVSGPQLAEIPQERLDMVRERAWQRLVELERAKGIELRRLNQTLREQMSDLEYASGLRRNALKEAIG